MSGWFDFDLSDIVDSAVSSVSGVTDSLGSAISSGFDFIGDGVSALGGSNWLDSLGSLGDAPYSGLFEKVSNVGNSSWLDKLPELGDAPAASNYSGLGLGDIVGSVSNGIDKAANYLNTPGGKLAIGLGTAGVSALDAMKRNELMKKAYKEQQKLLAARQAQNLKYDAPLHLTMDRTAVASPEARRGESAFFTNNRLPSYFAEGGGVSATQPSVLGFIQYLMSGKKLPAELEEEKRRLRAGKEGTMMEGAAKIRTRREQLEEQERQQGLAKGGSPRYVKGPTAGQDDKVDARLSDGEYVFDADVVSALGDGNNEAGALKLDQMRENVRQHKRSAPKSKIPPKAKSPLAYMKPKGVK